jgi:hypothetical protein
VDRAFWSGRWLADGRVVATAEDAAVTKAWIFGTDGAATGGPGRDAADAISRLAMVPWSGPGVRLTARPRSTVSSRAVHRGGSPISGSTAKYAIAKNEVVEWDIGRP